jgi:hypothetical protein
VIALDIYRHEYRTNHPQRVKADYDKQNARIAVKRKKQEYYLSKRGEPKNPRGRKRVLGGVTVA